MHDLICDVIICSFPCDMVR